MNLLSADNLLVLGLFALLSYIVASDVARPGFQPSWQLYFGLLAAILVVMGHSLDSQWVTIGKEEDDSS